jgi:hypothetical protein
MFVERHWPHGRNLPRGFHHRDNFPFPIPRVAAHSESIHLLPWKTRIRRRPYFDDKKGQIGARRSMSDQE